MSLTPPKRESVQDLGRTNWHTVFPIQFSDLVAAGYVDGGDVLSFGSTIQSISSTDGVCAFREGPKLGYPAALVADTIYVVSSAADTDTYTIHGLDANNDFQSETVTLTGTTPVAVAGTWNHVQRIVNSTTGTVNAGTIYVSTKATVGAPTTTAHQIQCVMAAGDNYAINPELVCPNDRIVLIHRFDFSTDGANDSKIRIEANRQGTWILNFLFYCDLEYHQDFLVPIRLFPGDRFRVTIERQSGSNVNAGFGMNGYVFTDTRVNGQKIAGGMGQLYSGTI